VEEGAEAPLVRPVAAIVNPKADVVKVHVKVVKPEDVEHVNGDVGAVGKTE
jgi:hypothetical protein